MGNMRIYIICVLLLVACTARGQAPDSVIVYPGTPEDWLQAIIFIESGNDGKNAYNKYEPEAKGLLCIFPIVVEDVNRILKEDRYILEDRLDDEKSIEMFWIYQRYYNPEMDFEKMCRIWCGGPDGYLQDCTLEYLELVKVRLYKVLEEITDPLRPSATSPQGGRKSSNAL